MRISPFAGAGPIALVVALGCVPPPTAAAQEHDYVRVQWWHPMVAAGGIATLFLIDQSVRDYVQNRRSASLDELGAVAVKFHDPKVYLASSAGLMSLGLMLHRPVVAQTGLQILASYALASGMMISTKWLLGRSRPNTTPGDPTQFDMFGGTENASLPSGASAVTFSLATTLADAVDHPAVTVTVYAAATLNAWARVNADRHWVSDVAAGALYGITAAKLVNGRWRLFGLRPPTVVVDPAGRAALAYHVSW